jgi:cytochrome c oxidase cbb3-type subunit I/II
MAQNNMQVEKFYYDNKIVRNFAYATILWGVVGMLVGLWISLELVFPGQFPRGMNIAPYLNFGRLRPLHTNAVIFAFVGNGIFMGVYYSLQRLCKARMYSDKLSYIHFWGWQLIIVAAAITLPLGLTDAGEYAELIWPIDVAITVIWVIFGWNMFATILKRREKHLYVAIWFYIATFVTVAVLHLVRSGELPYTWLKSYSLYAGVQDALVQWWYGHNAVAFFLTTPYLGLMYYFLPKAANRPIYSYRLSIIHFWALIFIYIWAGPHHLLYTALPNWAQSLGVVFSFMLIFPSWGGMINGLLTLRGAWDRVRDDVILKFMVVAVTAYGMATFEGPMLALKNVSAVAHYTDWIIAHVHIGGLGWNGMLTFGILYWLIPRIFKTDLYSKKIANVHFWLGTLGILFYAIPMYWAGFTQSSMWKQFTESGQLKYTFLETVTYMKPFYAMRSLGGTMYLVGVIFMVYNLYKTVRAGKLVANEPAEAAPLQKDYVKPQHEHWHRVIERKPLRFMIVSLIVILIGGIIELVPTFLIKSNVPTISSVKPYTPLELEGRDIYVREGCYLCHSQMIRPFRSETERYGEYSKAGEFVYDHPFQWGSKRIGPDLAREGSGNLKKTNGWHFRHFREPSSMSEGSIMPSYDFLLRDDLDTTELPAKIHAMITLGVPYPNGYEKTAMRDLYTQSEQIAASLLKDSIRVSPKKEVIALIAYLQRLGTDISKNKTAAVNK